MKLLIDAGNSRTKWAWCPQQLAVDTELEVAVVDNQAWLQGEAKGKPLQQALQLADAIWISNVAGQVWQKQFEQQVHTRHLRWVLPPSECLGLFNGYLQPTQLGADRWCNLLSVWHTYQRDALVVSAGTAITMDALLVRQPGKVADFLGGSIQPGLQLMWKSLQTGAAQLGYFYYEIEELPEAFATNSLQAMRQGCLQAVAGAIAMQYGKLAERCVKPPLLILTGGDAALLYHTLQPVYAPHLHLSDYLVLKGLATMALRGV